MVIMLDGKRLNVLRNGCKKGFEVKSLYYRNDMDPDDYIIQYGGEAFREQDHRKSSFVYVISSCRMQNDLKTLSYENDVLQYIHEVLEELALRTSPVERDYISVNFQRRQIFP